MAIPIIEFEFRRKLSKEDALLVLDENIKPNEEFQKLTSKIDFKEDAIEVLAANKIEFVAPGDENVVTFITRVVLQSGNSGVIFRV